ncbi:hypothetical protein CHS0354_043041 [Potamilus streckersoni]|uniref:Iron-binding zinc finger CDGSH type domain-containing protein n=1 Tax=Potamilus streckersoni TaxID=2493646 RepID=A0AAE0SDP4_9BIVA|nr:hypothetical protein CHS0354_043041 [Potamilus streckersoni]
MAAPLRVWGVKTARRIFTLDKRFFKSSSFMRGKKDDDEKPVENIPKPKVKPHPETPAIGEYEVEPPKGKIYDKKPFKMELQAGKKYAWCVCGLSHTQPLCDGTHKTDYMARKQRGVKFHPHSFKVTDTKEYWLCNCKQTDNRPFCDGSHKMQAVQDAIK